MTAAPDSPRPYRIRFYPEPILRKRARELTLEELRAGRAGELDLRELVARMFVTMQQADGVGLAAPQVGVGLRLFVVNPDPKNRPPCAVFNPVLGELSGAAESEEGCLSLPGIRGNVKRAARLVLSGLDANAQPFRRAAEALEARIYQHENDHLDGVLLIQRFGTAARFMHRQQLRALEDDYEIWKNRHAREPHAAVRGKA